MALMTQHSTDHFSAHAASYAQHRPSYPDALFDWLASLCTAHDLAWDCGTGNGQAALALAPHFARVRATDLSAEQIAQASAHPRIEYAAAPADESGLAKQSADLITVAQALHWFDHTRFYAEVARVLRPGGIFAAWTYRLLDAEPDINAVVAHFHSVTVGPWWPAERRWVDAGYQGLPFPFDEIAPPSFAMEREWTLAHVLDYLRTWSATQRYIADKGVDPVDALRHELAPLWGDPTQAKRIVWPLAIRCGRVL
jgi:SAM-dependent methyltransferase